MYEFLKKDLIYKIAALFLAILLWFFVTNLKNPVDERTISVPLSYHGLKEGLVIGEKPDHLDVRLRGIRSLLNPLTEKDIKATVDLSEAKLGESSYLVNVTTPPGIELVQIKQGYTVLLKVDAILMRQLAIQVEVLGSVADGYSSYDPVVTPSTIVVRGAKQILDRLETAQVTIDLNQAKDNLVLNPPVNLLDTDKNPVSPGNLEISPATVQVFVPVIQNIPTKTVPIKPELVGTPKEQWRVARVVLEPETVKITGPYEKLAAIDHVLTQPIDTQGIEQNLATQVGLVPPEGVSLLYEPAVKVVVHLEEAPIAKIIEGVVIEAQNQPEGVTVEINPHAVNITVQGSRKIIDTLTPENLKGVVDLKDLTPGTYQLEAMIKAPSDVQVTKVTPNMIDVAISEKKEGSN